MAKRNVPEPPEPEPTTASLSESCAIVARNLVNEYFKESSKIDTEGLRTLRALSTRLLSGSDSAEAFNDFVDLLEDVSAVSAFELQASGVLPVLVKFLAGKGLASDKQKLARLRCSAVRLMSRKGGVTAGSVSGECSVVAVAKKLVSVLETMDEFDLKTTPQPRFSPSSFSRSRSVNFASMSQYHQALYALTQPLKLSLCSAPGSKLRDCTASTVLVEPLAKLSAVEDFVTSRVRPHEPGRGVSGSGRCAGGTNTSGGLGTGRFTTKAGPSGTVGAGSGPTEPVANATHKPGTSGSGFATASADRLAAAAAAVAAGAVTCTQSIATDAAAVMATAAAQEAATAKKNTAEAAPIAPQDEEMQQGGNDQDEGDTGALREAFEDAQQQQDNDEDTEFQVGTCIFCFSSECCTTQLYVDVHNS